MLIDQISRIEKINLNGILSLKSDIKQLSFDTTKIEKVLLILELPDI